MSLLLPWQQQPASNDVSVNAEVATGTGTAYGAAPSEAPTAGQATGTGTAYGSVRRQSVAPLGTGLGIGDASVLVGNALFAINIDGNPTKLIKWPDASDLSTFSATAFPNDGKHNLSQHLVYEPTTGLLYCAFAASGDDGNEFVITTIDPDTLVMVDIFDGLIAAIPTFSGILAITTDSTYIYAGTKTSSEPSWVLRFLLDGTYVDGVALANANARRLHSIMSDGTRLYVQGTRVSGGTVGWVAWLELDLSAQAYLQIGTKLITDGTLLIGSDFWIAEESASGTVHAVAKDLGTNTSVDTSALGTTGFDGMMYDGTYVWAVMRNDPSTVIAIDPVSKTVVSSYALLTGENTVNEILPYDNGHIILTYQTSGRAIFEPVVTGASVSIAVNAGQATGTGTAYGVSAAQVADAGQATGTGAANDPSVSIAVNAGLASGTGQAYDATVTTTASLSVTAGRDRKSVV